MPDPIAERDRARSLAVAMESAVAERDALLRDARALLRPARLALVGVPHWDWDRQRQASFCRVCKVEYDARTPGHRHGCDCGYEALAARIDGLVGGEQ